MEVSDLITARWKPHRDTSDLRPTCTTVESNSDIYVYIYISDSRRFENRIGNCGRLIEGSSVFSRNSFER